MISVSPLGAAAAPVSAAELPLSPSSEPPQAARATAPRTSTSGAMVFFHPVFIQFPSSGGSYASRAQASSAPDPRLPHAHSREYSPHTDHGNRRLDPNAHRCGQPAPVVDCGDGDDGAIGPARAGRRAGRAGAATRRGAARARAGGRGPVPRRCGRADGNVRAGVRGAVPGCDRVPPRDGGPHARPGDRARRHRRGRRRGRRRAAGLQPAGRGVVVLRDVALEVQRAGGARPRRPPRSGGADHGPAAVDGRRPGAAAPPASRRPRGRGAVVGRVPRPHRAATPTGSGSA